MPARRRSELNVYYVAADPRVSAREVEQRHLDVLAQVKAAVTIPVAVKLSPYFSSVGELAVALNAAGADALVLFNRFMQPDIDPELLTVVTEAWLSDPAEGRLHAPGLPYCAPTSVAGSRRPPALPIPRTWRVTFWPALTS